MEDKPDETADAGSSPGGARKRTPPTIELTASEVAETPSQAEAAQEMPPQDSPRKKKGWRARGAAEPAEVSDASGNSDSTDTTEAPSASEVEPPLSPSAEPAPHGRPALVAAVSGAIAALVVAAGALALQSNLQTRESDSASPAQSVAIDALNTRLAKLESKPSPVAAAYDDSKIQSVLATVDGEIVSLQKDVGALRTQVGTASSDIAALKSAPGDTTPSQAITNIEARLSKLEQTVAALSQQKAALPPPSPDDGALRRAVVATALDQSVSQGAPYATALAAAALGGNAQALQPLQAFAATGVPGAAEMSRELLVLLKPLEEDHASISASASLMQRLKASVLGLVRITHVDPAGNDRAALLQRAAVAARRDDVSEARRAVMQLPEADRAALKGWIDKATAREAALAASRQFAQQATAALPKPSSSGPQ